MSEFWIWFWRPIAEFLGVIAFLAAILGVAFIGLVLYGSFMILRDKWRKLVGSTSTTTEKR